MAASRNKSIIGTALAGVMWMLVLMIAILAVGAQSSRLDSRISLNTIEKMRGRWLCRAGAETAMAYLKEDLTDTDSLLDDWAIENEDLQDVPLTNGSYTVIIVDECSKLNLNTVSANQLLALDSENMDETIAESIMDWRDSDDEPQLNGAESGFYLNLPGGGYLCRNSRFRTPREVLRVRGMTDEFFYGPGNRTLGQGGWSRYLTCYSAVNNVDASGNPRVNVNSASENELISKLSLSRNQAQWIVQNRTFRSLSDLLGGQSKSGSSGSNRSGGSSGSNGRTSRLDDLNTIPASHTDQMIWYAGQSLVYTPPLLLGADGDSTSNTRSDSRGDGRGSGRGDSGRRRGDRGRGEGQGSGDRGRGDRNGQGDAGRGRPGGSSGSSAAGGGQADTQLKPLDWETLSRIYDQITLTNRSTIDGVININTVSLEVLRAFLEGNDDLAGKIINYRESMGGQITNVFDLLTVEGMTQDTFKKYIDQFSVRSSVYMIHVTATSSVSGVRYTTEMVVNRDRQGREVLYKLEGIGS